jgi:hypothetical protein
MWQANRDLSQILSRDLSHSIGDLNDEMSCRKPDNLSVLPAAAVAEITIENGDAS